MYSYGKWHSKPAAPRWRALSNQTTIVPPLTLITTPKLDQVHDMLCMHESSLQSPLTPHHFFLSVTLTHMLRITNMERWVMSIGFSGFKTCMSKSRSS